MAIRSNNKFLLLFFCLSIITIPSLAVFTQEKSLRSTPQKEQNQHQYHVSIEDEDLITKQDWVINKLRSLSIDDRKLVIRKLSKLNHGEQEEKNSLEKRNLQFVMDDDGTDDDTTDGDDDDTVSTFVGGGDDDTGDTTTDDDTKFEGADDDSTETDTGGGGDDYNYGYADLISVIINLVTGDDDGSISEMDGGGGDGTIDWTFLYEVPWADLITMLIAVLQGFGGQ